MISLLSLVIITKNAGELIEKTLKSVRGLTDEIIIVDDYSSDKTVEIAKKYQAKVYLHHERNLGKQKAWAIKKAKSDWILILDADESLSPKSKNEIKNLFKNKKHLKDGYYIPFQNHFLGRRVNFGGENYKMLRLFKKNKIKIKSNLVHEKFEIKKGKIGSLKNKIYHYSYRSIFQVFFKFTDYAIREAEEKIQNGEKGSLKKTILYPLHMFWARFIKDKGYKDGLFRIPLDLAFAYMEFLTYFLLAFFAIWSRSFGLRPQDDRRG